MESISYVIRAKATVEKAQGEPSVDSGPSVHLVLVPLRCRLTLRIGLKLVAVIRPELYRDGQQINSSGYITKVPGVQQPQDTGTSNSFAAIRAG